MTEETDARHRNVKLLFWGVLLLGVVLRFYHLGTKSIWYDEGASLYLARYVDLAGSLFDKYNTTEPPMMATLAFLWTGLIHAVTNLQPTDPLNDWLIRLLPFAFSVGSLPLVYVIAKDLLQSSRAACVAMLLVAVSPFQVFYAQEFRIYSFYVLLCLLALWCMRRALERDKTFAWCGMVLCMATMLYSHFFSVWTVFTLNVYFLTVIALYCQHFWKWTAANAINLVLVAPALVLAKRMNDLVVSFEYTWYPNPTLKTGFITWKTFFAGFGPTVWAYWVLFLLTLALFGYGLWSLRNRKRVLSLVAVLTLLPVVGNVIVWRLRDFSFYEDRLFLFSGVMACIGVAAGWQALPNAKLRAGVLVVLLACAAPMLRDYYADSIHPVPKHRIAVCNKVDFRDAARFIDQHWQERDLIAHESIFTIYPMLHYTAHPQVHLGGTDLDAEIYSKAVSFEELLRRHQLLPVRADIATANARRIWFVQAFGITADDQPQSIPIADWLRQHFTEESTQEFDGVRVTLFVSQGT